MNITEKQIEFIRGDVRNRGIKLDRLAENLVDHICCAMEDHQGSDFNGVYEEVINSFGEDGLIKIQQETILLLSIKKEEKMKKTMYVTGFIATILTTTGLLFKLQHWQGACIILVLGIALVNFGFLPMYFYDRYRRSISE